MRPYPRVLSPCLSKSFSLFTTALLLRHIKASSNSPRQEGKFEMHILNVRQGNGIPVRCPEGARGYSIDFDELDQRFQNPTTVFRTCLAATQPPSTTIGVVIAPPPHSDHIGSMRWVGQHQSPRALRRQRHDRHPGSLLHIERRADVENVDAQVRQVLQALQHGNRSAQGCRGPHPPASVERPLYSRFKRSTTYQPHSKPTDSIPKCFRCDSSQVNRIRVMLSPWKLLRGHHIAEVPQHD